MRALLALFITVVIAKPDSPHVQAPGMYPPVEMKTDIPTMPMNPYQMTMTDTSSGFEDYQFYYEKDTLPSVRETDNLGVFNGYVERGPIPPPSTESRQLESIDTSNGNGSKGPLAFYDTSQRTLPQKPSPPSSTSSENNGLIGRTPSDEGLQRDRVFSTSRPDFSEVKKFSDNRAVIANVATGQEENFDGRISKDDEEQQQNKLQLSTYSKEPIGKAGSEGSEVGLYDVNVSDLYIGEKGTRTQQKPVWSTSKPIASDSYIKVKRKCCSCCGTAPAPAPYVAVLTKGPSQPSQGQQEKVPASILDNLGDQYREQQQAVKNARTSHIKPNIVEKTEAYIPLPSSNSPNTGLVPLDVRPDTSLRADPTSHGKGNSYDGRSSLPLESDNMVYSEVASPSLSVPVYQTSPSFSGVLQPKPLGYGPSGCPCAVPSIPSCCAPIQPCCLPSLPCCPPPPPIPCCPQPPLCCQPPPQQCCIPQPVCCPVPTAPPCFRACPICPCRRRLHQALRIKRTPGFMRGSGCRKCAAGGQLETKRRKRQSNCKNCSNQPFASLFSQPSSTCTACRRSDKRTARVKRMGCLPCSKRLKRGADDLPHHRVKRFGCMPCFGRKKRSPENCKQCSNLHEVLQRSKRSFGCSPCGRKKREVRASAYTIFDTSETCDNSCCDYSRCSHKSVTQ